MDSCTDKVTLTGGGSGGGSLDVVMASAASDCSRGIWSGAECSVETGSLSGVDALAPACGYIVPVVGTGEWSVLTLSGECYHAASDLGAAAVIGLAP